MTPRPEVPRAAAVDPLVETLAPGARLVQVFPRRRGALTFNPAAADGRFRPVRRSDASVEPTAYLASDEETALAETVLRGVTALGADDVPRRLYRHQLGGLSVVEVVVRRPLRVVRLHGAGLVRLGLRRADVIDCEELDYPYTAAWGQSLWGCRRRPAGIAWTSRQNDSGRALMLWESRVRGDALEPIGLEIELDREPGIDRVRVACVAAGVELEG